MHFRFTSLFLIILLYSCSSEQAIDKPIVPYDHIQHFGFTLIDTYWDDPTDELIKTNYIDEVYSFINVADLLIIAPEANIVPRLTAMAELEVTALLHLLDLLFEVVGTDAPSGVAYDLRPDYQERWNTFVSANDLVSNQGLINAFYVGEEPTWNGVTYDEMKEVSDYIKSQFPNVPILLVEAFPALNDLQVPESVDWVGFDHYFIKDPNTNDEYQNEWALLKSKRSRPDQKLIVIMDTHYIDWAHGDFGGIALNEMGTVAKNYYQLAKSDDAVIGIIGYYWPNGFDIATSIGARGMPQVVKDVYVEIGQEISRKN